MNKMYQSNPSVGSKTIYNTPVQKTVNRIDEENKEKALEQPQIKLLREAHITELTLGNQTLRVMDAGHIQGVINLIEKQSKDIQQIQKTVNTQNKTIQLLHQNMKQLQGEVDELKRKLNGNYL